MTEILIGMQIGDFLIKKIVPYFKDVFGKKHKPEAIANCIYCNKVRISQISYLIKNPIYKCDCFESQYSKYIGQKFSFLVIKEIAFGRTKRDAMVECDCDCGKSTITHLRLLLDGTTKSCGCLLKIKITTHGLSNHPLYNLWIGIRKRCLNKNDKSFKHYGERGILVHGEWIDNFEKFYNDILNSLGPKPGCFGNLCGNINCMKYCSKYSLDRINNNGNYEPGNLRWANSQIQSLNKSRPREREILKIESENFLLLKQINDVKNKINGKL